MAAVKCPECAATFKTVSTSAKVACPKCGAKFTPRARTAAGDDEKAPASRRALLLAVIAAFAFLYLIAGAGLAMYLMKGAKATDPAVASRDKETPAEAPVAVPTPAASEFRPAAEPTPEPEARPALSPAPNTPTPPVPDPAPAAPAPKPPDDGLTDDQRQVNQAIDRGVEYLKLQLARLLDGAQPEQQIQGAFKGGLMAFMGYTLLECGVPASDPLLQRTAAEVRSLSGTPKTYSLATTLVFLDRLGDANDRPIIRHVALRLVLGQGNGLLWSYDCPSVGPEEQEQIWAYLDALQRRRPVTIPLPLRQYALFRVAQGEKPLFGQGGDHSNTQFAVLGLWVALRHQLPVQPTLTLTAQCFRATQFPDGSWGYFPNVPKWRSSMTCSGLLALAIGRSLEPRDNRANDKKFPQKVRDLSIEKAFVHLSKSIDALDGKAPAAPHPVGAPPPPPVGIANKHAITIGADAADDFYFLWSLERAALVYDIKTIGGRDWYDWASKIIVRSQQADGSWADFYKGAPDTCFALLVLKRINVVKDLTVPKEVTVNIKEAVANIKNNDKK